MDAKNFYWRIEDGGIWGFIESKWLEEHEIPTDGVVQDLYDSGQPAGLDYLKKTIAFYGGDYETSPLQQAKAAKIAKIDTKTTELIKHGFEYAEKRFSMSDAAQRNWAALAAGLANDMLSFPMPISTVDEATHILTSANDMKVFLGEYLRYQANPNEPLGSGRALKEYLAAAESIEEVEAIVDDRE